MKKGILLLLACTMSIAPLMTFATDFEVIPEANSKNLGGEVDCVAWTTTTGCATKGKTVRDRYNNQSKIYDNARKPDLWASFATGIFSRNSVLEYIIYIVKFISEIGLVIGAGMIIYAGYKYASAVFSGKSPSFSMVKDAIIGVLVIIFSYAIIKALSAAFL